MDGQTATIEAPPKNKLKSFACIIKVVEELQARGYTSADFEWLGTELQEFAYCMLDAPTIDALARGDN